ncbi:syntaxin-112 [Glycine max]|uniref:syntaxin-112 n=1 Tax=Glycine max TaxID=3847 RepID=UPI0003DECDFC|nr:syntaxin-112 [Glycine max]|eukprot:XP_006580868.1 syntaxin-112-like [Glycine max]
MNDLMTKSFQSYAELKKQAEKDNLEDSHDIEAGKLNNPTDYHNLSQFFQEVEAIKVEMEEVATLLFDLLQLHEETKCTDSAKVLRGLRDRMVSDMNPVKKESKLMTRMSVTNRFVGQDRVASVGNYANQMKRKNTTT